MPEYAKSKSLLVLVFFRVDADLMILGLTEKVKFTLEENSPHKLMEELDQYIRWYNEKRIKLSLGAMSPVEYRQSLGYVV